MGGYFLLRFLIRDDEDIARLAKTFAVIVSTLAVTMMVERVANVNMFATWGAVWCRSFGMAPSAPRRLSWDRYRRGPSRPPSSVFSYGCGTAVSRRVLAVAGVVGALVMVVTSASSTPVMAFPAGVAGILCGHYASMRMVRWGLVLVLVSLHLVMKAPVWMLIHHVDVFGASSGFHRAMLVDGLIRHFGDWWLIGVRSTASWGWDMWDQANQFVAEGETGGLATFICFVLLVSWCFGRLGTARRRAGKDRRRQWTCWLLGCALFSHVVAFFGISFSDQSSEAWLALLASICAATVPAVVATKVTNKPQAAKSDWIPEPTSADVLTAAEADSLLVRLTGNVANNGAGR